MKATVPHIINLTEVDSTNRYAGTHFPELTTGTLIAAEYQTAGKGRYDRRWLSPPDQNAYVSFVIKDCPYELHKASWIGSLATLDALQREYPDLAPWLKWPNDIYCGERKIAGILCEGIPGNGKLTGIVIGIGVNINLPPALIEKIDQPATSVLYETGRKHEVQSFVRTLAECLAARYDASCRDLLQTYAEWKKRNRIVGREVELVPAADGETVIRGVVSDLGRDGELIFVTSEGTHLYFSGDVRIRRESLFPPTGQEK